MHLSSDIGWCVSKRPNEIDCVSGYAYVCMWRMCDKECLDVKLSLELAMIPTSELTVTVNTTLLVRYDDLQWPVVLHCCTGDNL